LTDDLILARQITHFDVAGPVGIGLEISLAWGDATGSTSVDDKGDVFHP
jgi:hypothetical protein